MILRTSDSLYCMESSGQNKGLWMFFCHWWPELPWNANSFHVQKEKSWGPQNVPPPYTKNETLEGAIKERCQAGALQGAHFGGGGGEGGQPGRRWRRSQWERHLRGLRAGLFHPVESFTCSWRKNTGINIFPALHHFPSTIWKVVVWYQIFFCPGMRIRMAKQFRQWTHTSVKDSDLGN